MVSMIPFGLLAGFAGEREIRITEIEESRFKFRIRKETSAELFGGKTSDFSSFFKGDFKLCFYDMGKSDYREIVLSSYKVEQCAENISAFYQELLVHVFQEDYAMAVRRLLGEYSRYIRLKLEEDDSFLAQNMTGYPGEKDVISCKRLEEQMQIWENEIEGPGEIGKERSGKYPEEDLAEKTIKNREKGLKTEKLVNDRAHTEMALELDRPELYQLYLNESLEGFTRKFAEKSLGICRKMILEKNLPDRLYIGNQFCHLLFPERTLLFRMLEKADREGLKITISFSYIREYMLDYVQELLREIDCWCADRKKSVEVVINDWGMAEMVKEETENLISCMGVLLNKRKKDPRIPYKKGNKNLFRENNLNAEFYLDFLKKEFGFQRFEWESCGYEQQFPEGKNSLHLPFYQTNTSQYCPLRAVCVSGERGLQKLAKECPGYCGEYAFLYPEHLHMVGRYNSLFGIDMDVLRDARIVENCIKNGVDRVVVEV